MPFIGEQVTRHRRGAQTGTDRYGNPVYGWTDTTLTETAGFDPGGSREPVEIGREQVVTTPKLYFLNARPDLTSADEVSVRGTRFTITGDPADWRSPFGSDVGGLVVELQVVEEGAA